MRILLSVVFAVSLAACGGTEAPAPAPTVAPPAPAEVTAAPAPTEVAPAAMGRVFFVEPADGATVSSPVHVVMGIEGMTVEKAGALVAGTGHHHIIIDGAFEPAGQVVPADDTHIHYGGGQTEADLVLPPGSHTLRLQFANGLHQSYGEALSAAITITVAE